MLTAIIYTSETGSCERYARELSRQLHLPCAPLHDCHVRPDGKIIYVGWLMAGRVVGYADAAEAFDVAAVVGVGMSPVTEALTAAGREKNAVPEGVPYFALQGGLHLNRLSFPMRTVMKLVDRKIVRELNALAAKKPLSAQEQATLRMAKYGEGEPAAWDCAAVVDWARRENGFLTKPRELAKG